MTIIINGFKEYQIDRHDKSQTATLNNVAA